MKKKILPAVLALIIGTNFMYAQGGRIDSTFGINGEFRKDPGQDGSSAYQIVIRKNGKILLGGYSNLGPFETMVQLKPDGNPDTTFGVNGNVYYQPNDGEVQGVQSLVLGPNGQSVMLTNFHFSDTSEIFVSRFDVHGNIDGSFGANGNVRIFLKDNINALGGYGACVAVQKDGKIIILGNENDIDGAPAMIIWRLKVDGTFDSTFGYDGIIHYRNFASSWRITGSKVLVQDDGLILLGCSGNPLDHSLLQGVVLVRLDTYGFGDPSFNSTGFLYQSFSLDYVSQLRSIALGPHGKIVVGAWCGGKGGYWKFGFMRVLGDANPDKTFGKNGKLSTALRGQMYDMALQNDGKIIAAGFTYINNKIRPVLERINANGIVDSSFGKNGTVIPRSDFVTVFNVVAIDSNNNIVAAGYAPSGLNSSTMIAARFLNTLSPVLTEENVSNAKNFNAVDHRQTFIYPNPVKDNGVFSYELDKNQKVSISLYDLNGKQAQIFLNQSEQSPGKHQQGLHFNGSITPGNYILVLQTATKKTAIKIVKQ